jgi:hypothetical protein
MILTWVSTKNARETSTISQKTQKGKTLERSIRTGFNKIMAEKDKGG